MGPDLKFNFLDTLNQHVLERQDYFLNETLTSLNQLIMFIDQEEALKFKEKTALRVCGMV